jgi:hypothetical protein
MNFELQNIDDYTKNLVWMLKALVQIEKEFSTEDWLFIKPEHPETAFTEICEQLYPKLANAISEKGDHYTKHLLYTIDISESQVAKAVALEVDLDFSLLLTKLIVRRCLQKVLIRNYYKSPEKFALGNSLEE